MEEIKTPYLVQRMRREDRPSHKTGVDAYFSFDYMGSSEFEWGSLPASLRELRSHADFKSWEPTKITVKHGDKTFDAWYVGPADLLASAKVLFTSEVKNERKLRFKEATNIAASYGNDPYWNDARRPYHGFDGWWAIDSSLGFAFFKKKEHAELWLKGLVNK